MAAPSVSGRRIQRGTNHGPGASPPLRMAMANWGPLVWEVGQYERLTGAGSVVQGPATAPQPTFDVRTMEGKVEIKRAEAF
jgi:hypothetical protein